MCVAAPGLVKSLDNNIAKIDYSGNIVEANAGLVKIKPGDYVLVHAGLVIQKINESEAKEMTELFNTLEELGNA
ncbi:MAG: HypC/HybG/HupF family hydrogenase formation chaperone [Candidatus Ornithomonoglobus sp.]